MNGQITASAQKSNTLLGLSIGTRCVGIAVLKDNELIDWKVQSFRGCWNNSKCSLITGTIAKHIARYTPDRALIRFSAEARPTRRSRQLKGAVEALFSKRRIPTHGYTLSQLKSSFGCNTRLELIRNLANQLIELKDSSNKVIQRQNGYYNKMFEAVACTLLIPAISHKQKLIAPRADASMSGKL